MSPKRIHFRKTRFWAVETYLQGASSDFNMKLIESIKVESIFGLLQIQNVNRRSEIFTFLNISLERVLLLLGRRNLIIY